MNSYSDAAAYLGAKTDRPLPGRATRIIRRSPDTIAIRYQSTDVITYRADGTIMLQTGGWYTPTTKTRIVDYTPARVWQTKGSWYIAAGSSSSSWHDRVSEPAAVFVDGMTIAADGTPIDPKFPTVSDAAKRRAFNKIVSKYIAAFAAHVTAGKLEPPGAGDCWGCLMQAKEEQSNETPAGGWRRPRQTPHGRIEVIGIDHYFSHFTDGYFVPSLLANAITTRGYGDPGLVWGMIAGRNDGPWAARILRSYFKDLKPALFASWEGGAQ